MAQGIRLPNSERLLHASVRGAEDERLEADVWTENR